MKNLAAVLAATFAAVLSTAFGKYHFRSISTTSVLCLLHHLAVHFLLKFPLLHMFFFFTPSAKYPLPLFFWLRCFDPKASK
jgi:hypothetical protein